MELADYLRRVVQLLGDTTPANVSVEGRFDPLSTRGSVAASLGTIVNELVANAVKHSFDADAGGRIDLSGVLDGAAYRITCRDDGSGNIEAASPDRRDGLGLRIMTAAVRQLDGSLVGAPSENGFMSLLEFPVRADR